MKRLKRTLAFTAAALTGAALVACGGGGGSGSAIPYTGNTAAAVITEENATEIALAAYSGGEIDSVGAILPMSVGAEEDESNQASRLEYLLDLSRELKEIAVSGSSAPEGEIQTQSYSDWWPEEGECGGKFEWSGSDPYADKGSVTFKFDNYCEYGTTLSGTVRLAWSSTAFTVSFDHFSIQTQSYSTQESLSAGGKIEFRWSESNNVWNETVTINMVVVDHLAEKEYRFENYRLSYALSFDDYSEKFLLSGRYYDSEFGRVDISTPVPVLSTWSERWPLEGVIQFNGANGSVRIVFVADGARIEWRPSLSGDNWELQEIISRSDFDIWF